MANLLKPGSQASDNVGSRFDVLGLAPIDGIRALGIVSDRSVDAFGGSADDHVAFTQPSPLPQPKKLALFTNVQLEIPAAELPAQELARETLRVVDLPSVNVVDHPQCAVRRIVVPDSSAVLEGRHAVIPEAIGELDHAPHWNRGVRRADSLRH